MVDDPMDWVEWHADYDVPGSRLAGRLDAVQARVREFLDNAAPGPIRVVSACAGQGRDLIGVLATHPRRDDVTARLIELDRRNVDVARAAAQTAGLSGVEVIAADASVSDRYDAAVPADLVLLCGIFGNLSDDDVRHTITHTDGLCAAGATVIWTRHRDAPDLVPRICDWFDESGFELRWLSDPALGFGVGAHRFKGTPRALPSGTRLFTFLRRENGSRGRGDVEHRY